MANCPPCFCPPCGPYITTFEDKPYVQCTMLCPPPCQIPTAPCPVKPLQMPCCPDNSEPLMTEQQAIDSRYSNFYNNYNVDYHNEGVKNGSRNNDCPPAKRKGTTMDGNSPCCEDYRRRPPEEEQTCGGCPTGFKPCTMKLTPPADCDPAGIWCAQVQPCPPKPPKKVSNEYNPGPCKRPCCKHWKPKDGPCLYDDPCKAHCFDHPPGIKPSGRYP